MCVGRETYIHMDSKKCQHFRCSAAAKYFAAKIYPQLIFAVALLLQRWFQQKATHQSYLACEQITKWLETVLPIVWSLGPPTTDESK